MLQPAKRFTAWLGTPLLLSRGELEIWNEKSVCDQRLVLRLHLLSLHNSVCLTPLAPKKFFPSCSYCGRFEAWCILTPQVWAVFVRSTSMASSFSSVRTSYSHHSVCSVTPSPCLCMPPSVRPFPIEIWASFCNTRNDFSGSCALEGKAGPNASAQYCLCENSPHLKSRVNASWRNSAFSYVTVIWPTWLTGRWKLAICRYMSVVFWHRLGELPLFRVNAKPACPLFFTATLWQSSTLV